MAYGNGPSDNLPLHMEKMILAYKELSWSPMDIAEQLGLSSVVVNKVIKRGLPVVRYPLANGRTSMLPPQVRSRKAPTKLTRCKTCGVMISTNYCLACAVKEHGGVRA